MSRHLDGSPKPVAPLWYVHWAWLRVRCRCGHSASIRIAELLASGVRRDMRCYEMIDRLRCSACGGREVLADMADRPGVPSP
jgi:hypothetical protein